MQVEQAVLAQRGDDRAVAPSETALRFELDEEVVDQRLSSSHRRRPAASRSASMVFGSVPPRSPAARARPIRSLASTAGDDQGRELGEARRQGAAEAQVLADLLQPRHQLGAAQQGMNGPFTALAGPAISSSAAARWASVMRSRGIGGMRSVSWSFIVAVLGCRSRWVEPDR
jgi:hypothetical protein